MSLLITWLNSLAVNDRDLRELLVSPLDREVVVRSELRQQVGIIAGLGDVVEPRIVHDGSRIAPLFGPFAAAQLRDE